MPVLATTSPAEGLLSILKGIAGFSTDWQLAVGRLMPDPDRQVVLRNTPGPSGEVKIAQDYPGVQVLVRSAPQEYSIGWLKAMAVKEALLAHPSHPDEYPALTSVTMRGDIVDMGFDDKNRPCFSVNFQLIVSYDSSGYRDE